MRLGRRRGTLPVKRQAWEKLSSAMARVSIITPAYNAAVSLSDALTSVLCQTYSDWELIVIDDGSTDNTRQLVDSHMPAFKGKLCYIYQQNRGLPAARNTGIRHARGDLI